MTKRIYIFLYLNPKRNNFKCLFNLQEIKIFISYNGDFTV